MVLPIESFAFENCSSLASITFPDSVTEIGYGAFEGCTGLKSAVIPKSVTFISDNAFLYCKELTIYGCKDSKAKRHADGKKIPFKYICEYPQNTAGHRYVKGICTVCGADERN